MLQAATFSTAKLLQLTDFLATEMRDVKKRSTILYRRILTAGPRLRKTTGYVSNGTTDPTHSLNTKLECWQLTCQFPTCRVKDKPSFT